MNKELSVIIPVYNEANRVKKSWKIIKNYFQNNLNNCELIFVNDGSTDNTLNIIKKLKANFPLKIISYSKNQGKGYAVKQGVLAATKNTLLFFDIDLSVPLSTTKKYLRKIDENSLIIGTRKLSGAKLLQRQNFYREKMGQAFTKLTNLILNNNCSDYTCGFKMMPTKLAKEIFKKTKINRWTFDAELIFLAKKMGVKIKEIPVVWKNNSDTRVNLNKDILGSFFDLIKIRFF